MGTLPETTECHPTLPRMSDCWSLVLALLTLLSLPCWAQGDTAPSTCHCVPRRVPCGLSKCRCIPRRVTCGEDQCRCVPRRVVCGPWWTGGPVVDHSWRPHQYSETEHQLFNFIQFNETSHHQLGFVGPDEQGGQDVQNQSSLNGDKGKNQLGHKKEFPNNTANEDQRNNSVLFNSNQFLKMIRKGRNYKMSTKRKLKIIHLRNKADDKKVKDEAHRGRENQFNFIQFKHEDE